MAGWISAFRAIPWGDLIAAAPVVARGTRKLWEAVRHQTAVARGRQDTDSRAQSLEAQVEELRAELTSASGFLATLAEQNARLIEAVAILQTRMRIMLIVTAVLAAAVIGLVVAAAMR